jgi:hypothetical protein
VFDDRFIYMLTEPSAESGDTLVMERLDTGIDGSSTAMRTLDEDLYMSLNFNWQTIRLPNQKEFIENMHFNGALQVSSKDILIFGGH